MEEMARRSNYVAVKYVLTNLKKDKIKVVKYSEALKSFDISTPIKDKVTKVYYDTKDLFFRSHGLNISLSLYSGKPKGDLVVRYDSSVTRINFLSDIPDTFIKKVNKKDPITRHYNYMATAILELIPKGLSADVFEVIRNVVPILTILKKRERYRIIHNNGLKTVFSFEKNTYRSHGVATKASTNKQKPDKLALHLVQDMLEIRMESPAKTHDAFNKLQRQVQLDNPMFLREKHSDLFIALDHLDL